VGANAAGRPHRKDLGFASAYVFWRGLPLEGKAAALIMPILQYRRDEPSSLLDHLAKSRRCPSVVILDGAGCTEPGLVRPQYHFVGAAPY